MVKLDYIRKIEAPFILYELSGALIVSTMLPIKRLLAADLVKKQLDVAIDMTGVSVIDSSGMALLNNANKRINEKRGRFILFGLQPQVVDSLTQTDILSQLIVVRDRQEFADNFLR